MNPPSLDFRLPCRGSRDHRRLVCAYSLPYCFQVSFYLWLCSFHFWWLCCLFLVCRARGMTERAARAATLIHVLPRSSFHLWLKLSIPCESAVAPFLRLPCRRVLAMVAGIRCGSAALRRWWTVIFFNPEGLLFLGSSGVFRIFKGCSNRLHLKLFFAPWASPWAGLIIGDLWQTAPNNFRAL